MKFILRTLSAALLSYLQEVVAQVTCFPACQSLGMVTTGHIAVECQHCYKSAPTSETETNVTMVTQREKLY